MVIKRADAGVVLQLTEGEHRLLAHLRRRILVERLEDHARRRVGSPFCAIQKTASLRIRASWSLRARVARTSKALASRLCDTPKTAAFLHLDARVVAEHALQLGEPVRAARVAQPERHLPPHRLRLAGRDQPIERRVGGGVAVQRDRRDRAVDDAVAPCRPGAAAKRFEQRDAVGGADAVEHRHRPPAGIQLAVFGEDADPLDLAVGDAEQHDQMAGSFELDRPCGRQVRRWSVSRPFHAGSSRQAPQQ